MPNLPPITVALFAKCVQSEGIFLEHRVNTQVSWVDEAELARREA